MVDEDYVVYIENRTHSNTKNERNPDTCMNIDKSDSCQVSPMEKISLTYVEAKIVYS